MNIIPPADANLVGCASHGMQNNTKNTFRGGFNQTESEVNLQDRYVKYVYDFATSQANGTIASICLTHKKMVDLHHTAVKIPVQSGIIY